MFPARSTLFAALTVLGLVFAATPAVADGVTGSSIGCVNVMLSRIGDGLAVYAALSNVVGFGVSTGQPGDGAEFAVMIVPSACGVGGLPVGNPGGLMSAAQSAPTLPPLP